MLSVFVIICPPLAVLLASTPRQAAANIGLTLFLYIPGVLHARAAVEKYTVARRYETLIKLLDDRGEPKSPAPRPHAA